MMRNASTQTDGLELTSTLKRAPAIRGHRESDWFRHAGSTFSPPCESLKGDQEGSWHSRLQLFTAPTAAVTLLFLSDDSPTYWRDRSNEMASGLQWLTGCALARLGFGLKDRSVED